MSTRLYLDSARLGLMSRSAQAAQRDFARFAGGEGFSLYYEQFLHDGFPAWPTRLRQRFPGLSPWHGIGELKTSLRELAGVPTDSPVLLAGRSTQLMRLAIRVLLSQCRSVLTPDLSWPAYRGMTSPCLAELDGCLPF